MIPTLSRYIFRETLTSWLAVTGVLLAILLTNQFAAVLGRAAEQGFPPGAVLELVALGTVQNVSVLLPVGLLLGVMLAFGRLYHDSEMTAVLACGVPARYIYGPVLLLAALLAGCVALLTFRAAPDAVGQIQQLRQQAMQAGEFAPIAPGRFRSFGGSTVLYAAAIDDSGELQRVFVKRMRDERYEIAVADRARHEISADGQLHIITLYDGERHEGIPGSAEFRILRFAENVIPIRVPTALSAAPRIEAWSVAELLNSRDPLARAELQWRFVAPLMVLLLAVLAVPLSRLRPRQGRYARIWLAIALYFVYFSLASSARVWLEKGVVPAVFGLWWVHALVVLAALALLWLPGQLARMRHRAVLA